MGRCNDDECPFNHIGTADKEKKRMFLGFPAAF